MANIKIEEYIPTIKDILMKADHSEITARDVRLKLEQEFKVDLTPRKHEVQQLVEECFDDLEISDEKGDSEMEQVKVTVKKEKKRVHVEERRRKSSTKSRERYKSKSKKLQKPRVKPSMSDYSSLEDDEEPPRKKRRGRKRKSSPIDSEAEYERRFEEELNGKKSKSKSDGTPKKKSLSHKKKKKDGDEGNEEKKKRKGVTGIHKPLVLSPVLSEFLNAEELSRLEVVKRLWAYIKENDLQDPNDKRYIVCDEKLMSIFKHERIHSFTMNKYLTDHLKKKEDLVVKVKVEQGNSSSVNGDDHDYALNDDHSEEVEVKTEALDEAQYKFDDDQSETVDDDGADDAEWAQD